MTEPLLPSTFLFRFACPFFHKRTMWSDDSVKLGDEHRLPSFGELEGNRIFADVRGGWNEQGLAFWVRVFGKKQLPWCRESRVEDSDCFQVWIDTRATQNIHRAGRFCHRFVFMPGGSGRNFEESTALLMPINRARENPKPPPAGSVALRSEKRIDGYILHTRIDAAALTGFDPREQPRLGFCYAVNDRELGEQTFCVSSEFPFEEDPSLWGALDLTS